MARRHSAVNPFALFEVFKEISGAQERALKKYALEQNETNVYVRKIMNAFEEYELRESGASPVAHESKQSQLKEEEDERKGGDEADDEEEYYYTIFTHDQSYLNKIQEINDTARQPGQRKPPFTLLEEGNNLVWILVVKQKGTVNGQPITTEQFKTIDSKDIDSMTLTLVFNDETGLIHSIYQNTTRYLDLTEDGGNFEIISLTEGHEVPVSPSSSGAAARVPPANARGAAAAGNKRLFPAFGDSGVPRADPLAAAAAAANPSGAAAAAAAGSGVLPGGGDAPSAIGGGNNGQYPAFDDPFAPGSGAAGSGGVPASGKSGGGGGRGL